MSSIQQNIEHITSQIRHDEQKCGRSPESVQLLAVSKTKPVEAVLEAYQSAKWRLVKTTSKRASVKFSTLPSIIQIIESNGTSLANSVQ